MTGDMSKGRKYTETQPKHGDVIVHCGHLDTDSNHFSLIPGGLRFMRPDGSRGVAKWYVECNKCFVLRNGDPSKLTIRGDGTWLGDEPAVFRTEN